VPIVVRTAASVLVFVLVCSRLDAAPPQADSPPGAATGLPAGHAGPPVPVAPEVMTRDAEGRVTVRAVRVTGPIRLDGRLDEDVYAATPPMSDLLQQEPVEGAVATERTEVWLLFDDERVYITFRCHESEPDALVANEMRRDNNGIFQNDHVAFLLDPFYDRRNGLEFAVNPIGGRWDGQISNESQFNADWNPVWDVAVGRFEGGWTVELAIPFKSLRYRPGRAQVWGFNARRTNASKNEVSFLTRVSRAMGPRALFQSSIAATVVGLEAPPQSRNVEIKPYVVSSLSTDRAATPPVSNDPSADAGLDVKYGVTEGLVADFTYNTDFAQVEADEQQVNLTRFSLFFPEKREFFLENQGLFGFGGAGTGSGGFGGGGDTPILFHSRRIGFDQGRAVPVEAGGRLTGRLGRFSLGVLNIQTDEERLADVPPTNFSVVRLKRDVLRRSSIGLMYTRRSTVAGHAGANHAYGVDGAFAFHENLTIDTYWARNRTDGQGDDDTSHRARLDYAGDRYGARAERLVVGADFTPEVGFVRRTDIRRTSGQLRFSPRPASSDLIRRLSWTADYSYTENGDGRVEMREWAGEFGVEFQSSDEFSLRYRDTYEFLPVESRIVGIVIPVGGYDYANARAAFNFGRQRPISGNLFVEHGEFYGGHRTTVGVSQGRLTPTPQLSLEPTWQGNWVELPQGSSTTHLLGSRVTYTMTPTMFTSALVQYNTGASALFANVRLRWEYRPGSELFVVLNEERDTLAAGYPDLVNRSLIVKVNRLLRF
jgi:hypothetical protein